jgi:site-specific DNA recombinase
MTKRKKKNEKPAPVAVTRVVLYARVSTDKQADQGHSIEAQLADLQKYAEALHYEIVAFETDAASASSLERPGLQRALARIDAKEADALVVTKLDRLTRSVRDLLALVEQDYALVSISESLDTRSAMGRLLLKILTSVSEWEREVIGERTSSVMQHMKANGHWTGGWPPFGYAAVDGVLVEDAGEQEIIARARALKSDGMSLRKIAGALPANPNTGKPFAASQIARMM